MTTEDTTSLPVPDHPGWFNRVPMTSLQIVVGTIVAIGWIAVGGTAGLVISMIGGSLIVLRGSVGRN